MEAVVWSDYLCPWAYLGTARTALLEDLGVRVVPRPYELHPTIPVEGRPMGERSRAAYERVGALCAEAGLPFAVPPRIPNSRRILETAEWVRANAPDSFTAFHDGAFRAMFVEGRDIGDPAVIDDLVGAVGADASACRRAVEAGELAAAVDRSRADALEAGVTGTPSWWLDDRLLLAGVQAPELYERMVARLRR